MHVAVSWGQLEMAELLLVNGTNLNTKNRDGKMPLELASHGDDSLGHAFGTQ
jgi:hypothetical protein